jgi:flagellar protein FliO/FliZ
MSGGIGPWFSATASLLAVLALIAGAARLIRSSPWPRPVRTGARSGRVLAVRESVALDTKRRLHLVQCGERQVVLLTGGTQDVVVGWTEPSR